MNRSYRSTVRQRFERDARSFDAIYRLERSPFWRLVNTRFRKAIFERYNITFDQAGDVTGKKILDVGCGSGVYAVDFARRGARRVVGVDFSTNMLRLAAQEAEQHRVSDRCDFVQADFLELDFEDMFNVSIAMGVFDYVPNQIAFLRKMVALTTGKVIVTFPGRSLFREPARRLRYKLTGKGDICLYSRDDVEHIASEAGLRDERSFAFTPPVAVLYWSADVRQRAIRGQTEGNNLIEPQRNGPVLLRAFCRLASVFLSLVISFAYP